MEQRINPHPSAIHFPDIRNINGIRSSLCKTIIWMLSVSLGALPFGIWFKTQQLNIFSDAFRQIYPMSYWLDSLGSTYLIFLIFCLASNLFLLLIFRLELSFRFLIMDSLGLVGFSLVYCGLSPTKILWIYLVWKLGCLILCHFLGEKIRIRENLKKHLLVLLLIVFSQSAFEGFVSPFAWDNPIHALKKMESHYLVATSSRRINSLPNAKRFDFSNYDKSFWGANPESVGNQSSIMLPFVAFFTKMAAIDVEAYYRFQMVIFYIWFIIASFSFYLFCLYGLKLTQLSASLGGVLFLYSNSFFGNIATSSFSYFSSGLLEVPLALLVLVVGVREQKLWFAFLAGVINTIQLYIQIPHPDPVLYSCVYLGVVTLWILSSNRTLNRRQKISMFVLLGAGVILGAALAYLPAFSAILIKESKVFGHLEPDPGTQTWSDFMRIYMGPILKPFIVLLPAFFILRINRISLRHQSAKAFQCFITLATVIFFLFVPFSGNCLIVRFVNFFGGRTFQFHCIERVLVYLSFSLLVALLIVLDTLERNLEKKISMTRFWLGGVIITMGFIFYVRTSVYTPLLPATLTFFVILLGFSFTVGAFKKKHRIFTVTLLLGTLFTVVSESTLVWRSPKLTDNPLNEKPYITLHSLLVKVKAVPEDTFANLEFLKTRFNDFLAEMKEPQFPAVIKTKLNSTLANIDWSQDRNLELIGRAALIVDDYYLNQKTLRGIYSFIPIYHGHNFTTGINYSMPSLFENIGSRFQWILAATGSNYHFGNGETFFFQEGNQGFDLKYMVGYPPLNALYITTPADYSSDVFPAGFQHGVETLTDPKLRKLNNIAGGEIYTVLDEDVSKLKDVKDLAIVPNSMPDKIRPPFEVIKDQRSYGMAYLVSSNHYIAPIKDVFFKDRPPFKSSEKVSFQNYRQEYEHTVACLETLSQRHAAFIETADSRKIGSVLKLPTENKMRILNIAGNKAVFEVECKQSPCQLVFNHANVSGWKAYSDQKELPIERANFAFISSEIPAGKHIAWFEYRPSSLIIGRYISLFCFLYCFWKLLGHFKMPIL